MVTDLFWYSAQAVLGIPTALAIRTDLPPTTTQDPNKLELFDPLKGRSLAQLTTEIIDGLVLIAIPVVTIMVIIGAYNIITSGGNPAKRTKGKDYILWAAIGFGILILADSVALIVENFLTS